MARAPEAVRVAFATMAIAAALALVSQARAAQTFEDPFDGEGLFVDIGAGSTGEDVGDAFFLRVGDMLSIRMFLDAPNVFIETHVCLSADPFTRRIPPGQCQLQATGAASGTYDIALPPSSFPGGTVPFADPLGPFCVQVHVKYDRPGLALTSGGGGSAFAGWQGGSPFFGNICFPAAPEPPPSGGTAVVAKTGEFVDGVVTFIVTVSNPTNEVALDVVLVEGLPAGLSWVLPPGCTAGPEEHAAICDLGDLQGGASVQLVITATPAADECGTFTNSAATLVGGDPTPTSADSASVEVPCPPDPPADPLILLTKEPSEATVTAPGTITYVITFENAGPGAATNVTATDELPAGPVWTIGSGSNVCSVAGSTLTCFAASVPDGVFEVLEIFGTVDTTDCGTLNNQGTVEFSGGPEPGSVTAVSQPVVVDGCSGELPAETSATPPADRGAGGLPNTATLAPAPIGLLVATVAAGVVASVLATRARRRS